MKIGGRIKELRLLNNLTQKELANKLGLTPKMISFYENSERTPPIDIILKLVSIFDVSSDYLLGLADSYYNNAQEDKNGTSLTDLSYAEAERIESEWKKEKKYKNVFRFKQD